MIVELMIFFRFFFCDLHRDSLWNVILSRPWKVLCFVYLWNRSVLYLFHLKGSIQRKTNLSKMQTGLMQYKLYLIASACLFLFGIMFGFIVFPKMLRAGIKSVSGWSCFYNVFFLRFRSYKFIRAVFCIASYLSFRQWYVEWSPETKILIKFND